MPRVARRLTQQILNGLQARAAKDKSLSELIADSGQPGLCAMARRGNVNFVFAYRPPVGGRRRRLKIDRYGAITLDQARRIAGEWRGLVAAGKDPQQEVRQRRIDAMTVADVSQLYLADLGERARTGARRGSRSGHASAKRRLERNVLPSLGHVAIRHVSSDQLRRLHRSMKDTPVEANRTLTALSAVFGFADRSEIVSARFNPCRYVERFEETGERHALTKEQLQALGEAIREAEEDGSVHRSALLAIKFFALTGCRRSELLGHESKARRGKREGLRWGDVDLESGTVMLAQTKTGAQRRVIGRTLVDLLRQAKPEDAAFDDPVCPGTVAGQPFVGIDRSRLRLYSAAGIEGVDLHSLRHSFASVGAHVGNGIYAAFVGPLLGHGYTKSRSITDRYIHSSPEALRPAADAIAREIGSLLGLC